MELLVIGSVLALVIGVIISWLIAKEFYRVACAKGYTQKKYLWISFFLGMVGYLLVVALPNNKSDAASSELPEL